MDNQENAPQTLAQRMAQGRIPVAEALRYAMILADTLRKIHDTGCAHGAVTPACLALTRNGLELLPALGSTGNITPYTAPEILQDRPADSRSDIYSFGAILYEMLTGRAAFQGDTPEALTAAIMNSAPAPSGSPAVDRMVANCLAKDPAARWQRVQKLLLELKLLSVAVRRTEAQGAGKREPDPILRAEIQQLEARMTERLTRCEQGMTSVNEKLAGVEAAVKTAGTHIERLSATIETALHEVASLRTAMNEDVMEFERGLKAQAATIESARTAMAQTDDLVERVVEALESLQSVVLEHSDDHALAVN